MKILDKSQPHCLCKGAALWNKERNMSSKLWRPRCSAVMLSTMSAGVPVLTNSSGIALTNFSGIAVNTQETRLQQYQSKL